MTFERQYLVAASSLLASMPFGCAVSYPSVLLQQLSSNDSSIQIDWDTASWIGSIHGIAGMPSIMMPAFMQWRGRRLTFILACLVSLMGWILAYTATSVTYILISESIVGFGTNCVLTASMFSLSEMLSPRIRMVFIGLYLAIDSLSMAVVQLAGNYFHWRTVSLVVGSPLVLSAITAFMWPESPAWLAYKGEFEKCAKDFTRLRGTGDDAKAELEELILAQKENASRDTHYKQPLLKRIWRTWKRRDFYLPTIHIFVILQAGYWSGGIAHIIYGSDIIERATHSKKPIFLGNMVFNSSLFLCYIVAGILVRYFPLKKVLNVCVSIAVVCLLCASAVNYSQTSGLMSKESYVCLYLLMGYMFSINMIIPLAFPIIQVLMPVKHRGIAGPIHGIFLSLLHTSALKLVPYMLKYFNLYGTLLVFATNATLCSFFMWKYIPETQGRTLQQIEDFYNYGNFDKCRRIHGEKCLSELLPDMD